MKRIPLLALAVLPLAACGGPDGENQSAELNDLQAGENIVWNDPGNISPAEANVADAHVIGPIPPDSEIEPTPPAREPARKAPPPPAPAEPEPRPEPDPHAGHDMNNMSDMSNR